jgi:hypothetical protein
MTFLIADTFTDSLARLTGDEQKAVKTTAFDLQMDPSAPGLSFHKLDKAKDKRFWSVRVNSDVRLIVHRGQSDERSRRTPQPALPRSSSCGNRFAKSSSRPMFSRRSCHALSRAR